MTAIPATPFLRRALLASAAFTLLGSVTFGVPQWLPGQLAGLPAAVPAVYRALAVVFMLLFAGLYFQLARQPRIERPLLAFAAIAKAVAFAAFAGLWLAGAASSTTLLAVGGDLVFAALFARALFQGAAPASLQPRSQP